MLLLLLDLAMATVLQFSHVLVVTTKRSSRILRIVTYVCSGSTSNIISEYRF